MCYQMCVWLGGKGQTRMFERKKSVRTDTNEVVEKWPPGTRCKSTTSLAVNSCKSTWIRDTKQPGGWEQPVHLHREVLQSLNTRT